MELFELKGSFFCPVTAIWKWRQKSRLEFRGDLPFFRSEDGTGFTPKVLNAELRALLQDEIDYTEGRISAHSFRAGLTTTMARLGYSADMISVQGRWASEAYLKYCKLGRANRLQDQLDLMTKMTEVSTTWISGGVLVR